MLFASVLFPLQAVEIERLVACSSPVIDWELFDALVGRHRIIPTVYRNLSTHAAASVPLSALYRLKEQAEINRQRILQMLAELGRITQWFSREGIQICVLKGPLLSQRLFGDVSLRTSSDIDLLIHPEEVAQAEALLLAHGYQRSSPAKPLTPRQLRTYQQGWRHFAYCLTERRIYIELHWTIASPNLVSLREVRQMLNRARPMVLAGANIHTLSEEDLPVYLLIHGSIHSWVRLKWLVDFVVWMRRTANPDWEGLKTRMADLGLQRSLAQGVLLANWLFSTPIPEPLQTLLAAKPPAQDIAVHSLKAILNARYTGEEKGGFQRLKRILYRMKLRNDLRYKWNALTKILAIYDDWMELPLPDTLYPLYWLLRPFLWLRRYHLRQRGDRTATYPPDSKT